MKSLYQAILAGLVLSTGLAAEPFSLRKPSALDTDSYIDANSLFMLVANTGSFAYDFAQVFGPGPGLYYPYTSVENILNGTDDNSPLYAAGLWLGGIVNDSPRVAIASFASEYWPGPMAGGTFIPGADTVAACRVYKLYADSLPPNANADYLEWPAADGAPTDALGNPLLLGNQTLWGVFNDANPAEHDYIEGSTAPLGIEIRLTCWASDEPGRERVIYLLYGLYNRGLATITDFYTGLFFDPDIGGASDDLTGCDTLGQFFFGYNADSDDAIYGSTPPAIGMKFLYGPIIPSPADSAWAFGRFVPDHRNLGLTSYVGYVNGDDPQSGAESYNLLRGLRRNGTPLANGTTFSYPGDPVAGTGDLNTLPANYHGVGSSGPVDLLPGDSQSVLIKLAVGHDANNLASVNDLRSIFNAPDSVVLSVPGDGGGVQPASFGLEQNYPNPFNPATTIEYQVPTRSHVTIEILNIMGQSVRTLVDATRSAGAHRVEWRGDDNEGRIVAGGVYLYRLTAGDIVESRKMVLLK